MVLGGASLVHAYLIWRFLGPWKKGQGRGEGIFPLCPLMIPECR